MSTARVPSKSFGFGVGIYSSRLPARGWFADGYNAIFVEVNDKATNTLAYKIVAKFVSLVDARLFVEAKRKWRSR